MTHTFVVDENVHNVSLEKMHQYTYWHRFHEYFTSLAGREHYKVLAHLASQCNDGDTVYDIGTYVGMSAIALATNEKINVVTYDIFNHFDNPTIKTQVHSIKNINFVLGDCMGDLEELSKATLIVLDIEPHDGLEEMKIIDALRDAGFKGICVCDDIFVNDGMKQFWNNVTLKKVDITQYGHWSGTGVIVFDENFADVVVR
jgi:predicted O-methyltransferase YrrM